MNPDLTNAMVLAYLGDSVFELLVREYLITESEYIKPNDLQKQAVKYVSGDSHAAFIFYALENKLLTEKEVSIYKRGRNTKNNKNETSNHRHSTGFEAIIGQLYLLGDQERISQIFSMYKDFINNKTSMKQV